MQGGKKSAPPTPKVQPHPQRAWRLVSKPSSDAVNEWHEAVSRPAGDKPQEAPASSRFPPGPRVNPLRSPPPRSQSIETKIIYATSCSSSQAKISSSSCGGARQTSCGSPVRGEPVRSSRSRSEVQFRAWVSTSPCWDAAREPSRALPGAQAALGRRLEGMWGGEAPPEAHLPPSTWRLVAADMPPLHPALAELRTRESMFGAAPLVEAGRPVLSLRCSGRWPGEGMVLLAETPLDADCFRLGMRGKRPQGDACRRRSYAGRGRGVSWRRGLCKRRGSPLPEAITRMPFV